MSDPRTDEELLAAVDGEPEAFGIFYRRHVRPLLGYFVRRTGDAELAADLCAETFAAALDGLRRFDPARGPAVAWLYGIARRRATRRRVVPVPRLRPVLALVALAALVVALVAVARGLDDRSRPGDERPQVPPPSGPAFALPAAPVAQPCPGVEQREDDAGIQHPLTIFTRSRTAADAVPELAGADSLAWIPAGTIHRVGARRAAREQFDAEVYLVPAAEPRLGGGCDGQLEAMLAVCLVAVDGETFVKCFSELEVEGGRAVAVTPTGVAYGVVPDRIERVTLQAPGGNVSANVHDNAFEMPITAKAGDEVRMELAGGRQCAPSDELLDAVPALRDGDWVTPPTAVEDALPSGGTPRWGRRIETGDRLELWLLVHCDTAERACVIGVYGGNWVARPCATAREIRGHGSWWSFSVGDRRGLAGLAPPGTRGAQFIEGDRVHDLPITGGAFGGLLPATFRPAPDPAVDPARVRFLR